jgi:hypothetical protein
MRRNFSTVLAFLFFFYFFILFSSSFGRLLVAHRPGVMEGPVQGEVSDTEIVLKWDLPADDGNSPILCYGLQYREAG